MCSRVLGLAREQIFAALFGAGTANDAFIAAFPRAPISCATFSRKGRFRRRSSPPSPKKIQVEGDDAAWRLANKMCTLLLVFMSGVTLLGILLSPQLIQILGHGFHEIPGKFELAVALTRIMYPFILMVSLAALAMGMLNAKKRVRRAPRWRQVSSTSAPSSEGSASAGFSTATTAPRTCRGTSARFISSRGWPGRSGGCTAWPSARCWAVFLQFVVQLPSLAKMHYRFHFDFRWDDPGVRTILRLMGPAVIAASAVQVNVAVNTSFASDQGNGAVSWLNSAFRLMQLPLGMFGVAIATVTLPLVSKSAALGRHARVSLGAVQGVAAGVFS